MFQTDEYITLTRLILQAAPAVRIFLLGTTQAKHRTASIFTSDTLQNETKEHYYVLVLVKRNREASYNCVQEKIEAVCFPVSPVTAIVLDFEQFNSWLSEGHPFACRVTAKALVLFEDMSMSLADALAVDCEAEKKARETAYSQGLNKVEEFLAGVDLYRIREQNKMAAFMLHQAAESALLTILKISLGLTVNSHNLDKLARYCSLATSSVADILKRNSENEKRLFQLLQRAYIETRYREDYYINTPDLLNITGKIRLLQEVLISLKCYT